MAKKILITGADGLIGTRLTDMLLEKGYEVAHLSRHPKKNARYKTYFWDPLRKEMDEGSLERTEAIIHLAGAGIAEEKWTKERKREIIESRTESLKLIYDRLRQSPHQIKTLVSSGGIGYYGDSGEEVVSEESKPGSDFLAESCIEWEKAVENGKDLNIRISQLRVGVVLSRKGGALIPFEKVVKLGVGSPLGSGSQWISWIHIDDLCRIFIKAAENSEFRGILNAVAPKPVRNKEFVRELASTLHKPDFFPNVPEFALNLMLGERKILVLDSQRVNAQKLLDTGFEFQFKVLANALRDLYPQA